MTTPIIDPQLPIQPGSEEENAVKFASLVGDDMEIGENDQTPDPAEAQAPEPTEEVQDDAEEDAVEAAPQDEETEAESQQLEADEVEVEWLDDLVEHTDLSQEDLDSLKLKYKVDGQEHALPLSEIRAKVQKAHHAEKETQAAVEEQKRYAAQEKIRSEEHRATHEQLVASIRAFDEHTHQQIQALEQIKHVDPARYINERESLEQTQHQVRQAAQRYANAFEEERAERLNEYRMRERRALATAVPDWDDNLGKQVVEAFRSYGYEDEELTQLYDHRSLKLASDFVKAKRELAEMKANVEKTQAEAKKVAQKVKKTVPKLPNKEGSKSAVTLRKQKTKKLKAKLKDTGDAAIAHALFAEMDL